MHENSVVDISSVKLVDESSVLLENTVKLEELDKKAVYSIPKCVFPYKVCGSAPLKQIF